MVVATAAWVGLAACAAGHAAHPPDVLLGDGAWRMPASVGQEVKRENAAAQPHPLTLPMLKGEPTVQVVSMVPPQLLPNARSDVSYFKVMLADDALAECVVRRDRLHVASALQQAVVEAGTHAQEVRLAPLATREVAGVALLGLLAEYLTPAHRYGALKVAAANVKDVGVFCSMNAPGHRATFDRMVDGLVGSLAVAMPDAATSRTTHWVTQTGGWRGVAEVVGTQRDDGSFLDLEFLGLLQVEATKVTAWDELGLEVADADGTLRLARWVRQDNGKATHDVTLSPTDARHVGVRRAQDRVPRDLGREMPSGARAVRQRRLRALKEPGSHAVLLRFEPSLDDLSLAEETLEAADGGTVRSTIRTQAAQHTLVYDVGTGGEALHTVRTWDGGQRELTPLGP